MSEKLKKISTGVKLDADVVAYLDELARQSERSRNWVLNAVIRDHARRQTESGHPPQVVRPTIGSLTL